MTTLRPELSGIVRASRRAGGAEKLGIHLGCSRSYVSQWVCRGFVPDKYAEKISNLTGVGCDELIRSGEMTGIKKAIGRAGGILALSRLMGVRRCIVSRWNVRGWVPDERAERLFELTGVPVEELTLNRGMTGIVLAICRAKGQANLAAHLNRSVPLISKWKKCGWVPEKYACAISSLTGVPIEQLVAPRGKQKLPNRVLQLNAS